MGRAKENPMNNNAKAPQSSDLNPPSSSHVHVVPVRVLLSVWFALLVLTVLTVEATKIDLGRGNLYVALLIAFIKAALVVLYFMHLRYDNPLNGIVLIAALLFVALFCGLALMDSVAYQPLIRSYDAAHDVQATLP
jgi:cytochrome c oxidase subunit 4